MKKISTILLFLILALFLWAGNGLAYEFGTNITIFDNRFDSTSSNSWYGKQEDQEVEPGMIYNQSWDLEGFFLDDYILTMVGGFNFGIANLGYEAGDIFIDIDGDAQYGSGADDTVLNYGYEYVLDLNFLLKTYDVYALNDTSSFLYVLDYNAPESNPWRYDPVNSPADAPVSSGSIVYHSPLSDDQVGFLGGTHYAARVNLSFLGGDINNFIAHSTMECGNDNLMGKVPEPSTMLFLGFGLVGLAAVGRKKFQQGNIE